MPGCKHSEEEKLWRKEAKTKFQKSADKKKFRKLNDFEWSNASFFVAVWSFIDSGNEVDLKRTREEDKSAFLAFSWHILSFKNILHGQLYTKIHSKLLMNPTFFLSGRGARLCWNNIHCHFPLMAVWVKEEYMLKRRLTSVSYSVFQLNFQTHSVSMLLVS